MIGITLTRSAPPGVRRWIEHQVLWSLGLAAEGVALGLLLASFFVTFGSTAMGTAIMALGQREEDQGPRGGTPAPEKEAMVKVGR